MLKVFKMVYLSLIFVLTIQWVAAQKKKVIELLHANILEYEKKEGADVKKLIGDVALKHLDVIMNCDSAYLYGDENRLEAYHNIHINKNDSVHIYGEKLDYDGNNRYATIHKSVKMESHDFLLFCEELHYDMQAGRAHYSTGAIIEDKSDRSILHSVIGYYFVSPGTFFFKEKVRLVHPDYVITTDTLKYDPAGKISWFLGPTEITSDTTFITCRNGWYDSKNDIAMFKDDAGIRSGHRWLKADSIYYLRTTGNGEAFRHIEYTDTSDDIVIRGNYGRYNNNFATSVVTDSTLLIMAFGSDSLFLHGDTLRAIEDSVTGEKTFYCYYRVRFYKPDLQGICDSVVYSESDSAIRLFKNPILWSDEHQLTGDFIRIKMFGGEIRNMWMEQNAFISSQVVLLDSAGADSVGYNQIQGKNMTGYFTDNHLSKIDVKGNGKTVYYVQDEKDKFIGINKSECSNMIILVAVNDSAADGNTRQKIDKITFLDKPEAILYPVNEPKPDDLQLRKFVWEGEKRPLSREDVFRSK
ncbi:MAG: hypothetical protein HYY40_07400 [Bacteroidetes bacterium]|nr:hypothetical protein [Bacteroidota bacterium]